MQIRVLSYNIHKGFNPFRSRYVLADMKKALHSLEPDLVFLQEVTGHFPDLKGLDGLREYSTPLEHLADVLWPHHAYGKNAIYSNGHHGNAILSKIPFRFWENLDISTNRFERRGLLHALVNIPEHSEGVHLLCVHLNLFRRGRTQQLLRIIEHIQSRIPPTAPLILAGDFNDWSVRATDILAQELRLQEACEHLTGSHRRTFPSWFPLLPLDRIYFRGLSFIEEKSLEDWPWRKLSDHSPLFAVLNL